MVFIFEDYFEEKNL